MTDKRKPVRILHNIRVDEISCVDKGAGENCRVVMRKRDSRPTMRPSSAGYSASSRVRSVTWTATRCRRT